MNIEIWSDIMCPFCYIGKHHFEAALAQMAEKDAVNVIWKSFQLDPGLDRDRTYASTYQYLAERKGLSVAQAKEMTAGVADAGRQAGLSLNFERTVIANTRDAHRLTHLAQDHGLASAMEETLFRAHFTDGEDVADHDTLLALGKKAGLDEKAVASMLESERYAADVTADIDEARQLGIRGVPFFVVDRKYAISGAQPPEAFLQTLEKAFAEWRKDNPASPFEVTSGPSCTPDGNCN